jgi:hypothetical protein
LRRNAAEHRDRQGRADATRAGRTIRQGSAQEAERHCAGARARVPPPEPRRCPDRRRRPRDWEWAGSALRERSAGNSGLRSRAFVASAGRSAGGRGSRHSTGRRWRPHAVTSTKPIWSANSASSRAPRRPRCGAQDCPTAEIRGLRAGTFLQYRRSESI